MLFMGITGLTVYSLNHTKHTDTHKYTIQDSFNVKSVGTLAYHFIL
jgi:hypothetical protein